MAIIDSRIKIKTRVRLFPPGALLCVAAFIGSMDAAQADPLSTINAIRIDGCVDVTPAGSVVAASEALDDVARDLSRSTGLNETISRTGYPAGSSVAIYLNGPAGDAAVRSIIERGYCAAVNNPQLNEFGIYRRGDEMWIVLAARLDLPAPEDAASIAARVLELVNVARETPRQCGTSSVEAAPPVKLSSALTDVALLHAQDMARQRVMDHSGSDGSQPRERVTRAGYDARTVGENVAAGQTSADEVVAAWLDSPGHCRVIMEPRFREMGVAFALAMGNPQTYWAQVFAAPR
jgi:uncharacterized protein YkwD